MASNSEKLTAFFEGRLNLRSAENVNWPVKTTSEHSTTPIKVPAFQWVESDTNKRVLVQE